jgi:Na+-driven multidrug efflux pump
MGQDIIVDIFQAKNETAEIIRIFCQTISITFIFTGITFVSMSLFNNLGYTKYATLFNFAKILFGTIPFVTIGAFYLQAPGILYGQAAGSILFAFIALRLTHIIINHIERKNIVQPVSSKSRSAT